MRSSKVFVHLYIMYILIFAQKWQTFKTRSWWQLHIINLLICTDKPLVAWLELYNTKSTTRSDKLFYIVYRLTYKFRVCPHKWVVHIAFDKRSIIIYHSIIMVTASISYYYPLYPLVSTDIAYNSCYIHHVHWFIVTDKITICYLIWYYTLVSGNNNK